MSGIALTTISPSSTSSSRSTPWVEGCCGPIEIVIWVSSGRSTTSNCVGMFTAVLIGFEFQVSSFKFARPPWNLKLLQAIRFVTAQRKVFSERVPLPIVRQENSTQVRMAVENNAEQIVCLSFVPIRGAPDTSHRRHVSIVFVQQHLQAHAMMFCCRE